MSKVFVLDTNHQPLNPVHPGEARLLLKQGKAAMWRRFPFTVILKYAVPVPHVEPLRVKLDPGSKTTGIAVLHDASGEVIFAAELSHRGHAITEALATRRAIRRGRRQRKTRYRKPRFDNRRNKGEGWFPPSQISRLSNVLTWVRRLLGLCPITACSMELVKFDMQQMENPEISGGQYQQGTLAGYEVREYLLEKWRRQCAYCGAKDVPLEIEHITPRSKSRDDRVCNLTLACLGKSTPNELKTTGVKPLLIAAQGHGSRQVTNGDRYGFPKGKPKQGGRVKGFRTGDMVKAVVPTGTKKGAYTGRVLVRASGSFDIVTKTARVAGISFTYCRVVQRSEGYRYALGTPVPEPQIR